MEPEAEPETELAKRLLSLLCKCTVGTSLGMLGCFFKPDSPKFKASGPDDGGPILLLIRLRLAAYDWLQLLFERRVFAVPMPRDQWKPYSPLIFLMRHNIANDMSFACHT